jgi:hypothetical protein
MHAKAQGLSLNAMVLGGLALLVLAVLIALFTGAFGGFGTELQTKSEQQCRDGFNGFKQMQGSCGEDSGYLYTQYFGNFKEDNIGGGKVCCRSECGAKNGVCEDRPCNELSKEDVVGGDMGCPANNYCCKPQDATKG